jgi:uncharacterized membrane protein
MKKLISVLSMVTGMALAILVALSTPLPADRISFAMVLYLESLAAGMILFGYFSYRRAINSDFGVTIFE